MKELYIKDLGVGTQINKGLFMVKNIMGKKDRNGKDYMDVVLGDMTGEVSGKVWNEAIARQPYILDIKETTICEIDAKVQEYLGKPQLNIVGMRIASSEDYDMGDFVRKAPEESEAMFAYLNGVASSFDDEDLKKLCMRFLSENRERLMYYPAASKNHHAEYGGLLYHTKRMLMNGERMCEVYTNLNRDLLLAGVILHDAEKLNEIESGEDGIATGYSFEGQMLGHIIMGVKSLDRWCLEIGMPYEKRIMLEHMILSHHYEPEFGSPKKPLFPEAEILHYLDIIDARMYDMEMALEGVGNGQWSEKVWTLDNRKIYKPEGEE